MSFTLCSSGAIIFKAGKNASTEATMSTALLTQLCDEAEALVCSAVRYDVVTNFANLTTEGKKIVQDIVSCHGAMGVINYDMSGFTSRTEAEIMLDILTDRINRNLALLKEDKVRTYLNIT